MRPIDPVYAAACRKRRAGLRLTDEEAAAMAAEEAATERLARAVANRRWRAENKDKVAEAKQRYYAENKDKVAEANRNSGAAA